LDQWELLVGNLRSPTLSFDKCRALWDEHGPAIMEEWIRAHPGTRPSWWWIFDSPRMSTADLDLHGWADCYFARYLPDGRKRLGGSGTPAHELENLVPHFPLGIPDDFRDVDPNDPPVYESQAAYLLRHGLFEPGEERRLKLRDYEAEMISVTAPDGFGHYDLRRNDAERNTA
jgi:hypothetical protein